jgi:integrase
MPVRPRRREVCPLLTPAQVTAILQACAARDAASGEWSGSLRDRLLFATLAETGMRRVRCCA